MVRTICTAHSVMAGCAPANPGVNHRSGAARATGSSPCDRTTTPRWRNSSAVPNRGEAAISASEATRPGCRSASSAPTAPPSAHPAYPNRCTPAASSAASTRSANSATDPAG